MSLGGIKIKAKTSMNKLTNEKQLKIIKQHFEGSIKLNEEINERLGEKSGICVPVTLTGKEKFKEVFEKVNES
ncbi:hypothetical protein [uncultured Methanobrevibacter sp.]|uniref:hypothetical protein n=1 Tax=uncultured Methanobrevibacter sp. TaxID=253161 RepID=UPI0025FF47DA|nr:hypothetical protein [uncultured Methanobrevibacter sp.]